MRSEDKSVDFKLEATQDNNGKYHFTATSLTSEFENPPCLERLARDSVNKHLIWRHRHPINDAHNHAHIFGNITASEVVNGRIISEYQPYGHTELHQKFIEEVKEKKAAGDPVGVSMRYRKYYDDDNRIVHLDVFEHSVTPYPKCEECLTIDEYIGEKEMPENKEKNEDQESEDVIDEEMTLEDRVKSLEEKLEKQKEDHKKEIDYLHKEPILEEMFEIKDLDEKERKLYKNDYSLEDLKGKLEEWKNETDNKPFSKTMEESANEAQENMEEESNEKKKKHKPLTEDMINEFTPDPRLRRIMKKAIKEEKD